MTEPSRAVFLSYASQDAEAARCICEALRAAGIEVWFDQSELRGGDAWDRNIRHQIRECALFVPLISANSESRLEGYFRREWKLAADRTLDMAEERSFLVPVVIDGTSERGAAVPDKFKEVQWTRLPGGESPPAFVERVSRLLSPDQHAPPAPARPPAGSLPHTASAAKDSMQSRDASWRSRPALLLIAAVAVIGVGYFAIDKFVLSKRVAEAGKASAPTAQVTAPVKSAVPEKSIAVLPFVDMSEKHDQEYFSDGMAEEILNLLTRIPDLKVIGRTSSFQFKGRTDDLRKIGTALGTAYVVEGSVRRSGAHIRVTAQLIDTRDGVHRWSQMYDRDASDVLTVQGEIAAGLVRALQLEVASPILSWSRASLRNSEAYETYLRGLHAFDRYDRRGFEEAAADFRHALELEPSFAPAATALALTLAHIADFGFVPAQAGWEQARVAAQAALKLDAKSALAHAILGAVYTEYDWDWPAAARELNTAVALAPNDPNV